MEIRIQTVDSSQKRQRPTDESKLGFGTHFSDHMFLMNFGKDRGWHKPRIEPYGSISLEPAASVLHYAQEIFEGLKAYRRVDGGIQLFRARENLKRMNRSAARLCMPALDEETALLLSDQAILSWTMYQGQMLSLIANGSLDFERLRDLLSSRSQGIISEIETHFAG